MNDKEILMDTIEFLDDKLLEDWYKIAGCYGELLENSFRCNELGHFVSTNEGDHDE